MSESKIYPGVKIGNGKIDEFCLVGYPKDGENETEIGENYHIRSHTIIYAGTRIGDNFHTGHHVMIREGNKIGNSVSIGTNSVVERDCILEDNVRLHTGVFVPEYTAIREGAWLGPNVIMTNAPHPLCPKVKECMKGPTIGKNAKIGANVTLLPYVKIGANCLIGAGSVVVSDIPPDSVAMGNPARVIRKIGELKCRFDYIDKPYK